MSKILVLNDFVSRGKLAGNMMEPVLSKAGHDVFFLPTALISNAFSFGNVAVHDTSEYIKKSFAVWNELGVNFDLIFIGFLENNRQKEIVLEYINKLVNKPTIMFDPIMGDDGKLYNSIDDEKIEIYKDIARIADIITPNYTEARFLGLDDFKNLMSSGKKYLITSCEDKDGSFCLGIGENLSKTYYEQLDLKFAGTGDLMDALFLVYYLRENDFDLAIDMAVAKMTEILISQHELNPDSREIIIEKFLSLIDVGGKFAG